MSNINSLLESSASGWKNMQSDAARMSAKWGKTGLLEGLGNEIEKNNMALILENQAKQLVVETSTNGTTGGTFTAGAGGQWAGVALPLVRKVFGAISSKEFVSVQPMNLPSGLVFFLDFQYGQEKQLKFGGPSDAFSSPASMYGNTNPANGADPSDGLYGAGRFGYTINQFSASGIFLTASATWADVDYDAELSASVAAGNLKKVTVTGSIAPTFDRKGVRAFVLSGSTFNPAFGLPQYTTTDNSSITFVFASGSGAVNGTGSLFYNVQPVDNNRGDFEDASGAGYANAESTSTDQLAIPQIDIKMKSEAIVAKTRKLKAQWTPEFAQDLNAYQALDAEAELTSIMSEYISLEIDLEVLDMLIQDASAADEYWSAVNNKSLNSAKTAWDNSLGFLNCCFPLFQRLLT